MKLSVIYIESDRRAQYYIIVNCKSLSSSMQNVYIKKKTNRFNTINFIDKLRDTVN